MYTLSLFGSVSIEQSGEAVKGLRSRKAIALLAYVAAHNKPLPRSHLAELFWQGEEEARGHANLRWVLNHLNSLLPGALTIHRHAVLCGKSIVCDLHIFSQNIQRNSSATLAAAAELYRGDFMAGFVLDGVPEFELWVAGERERWLQQAIQVVATLAHHASTQNNAQKAICYLRRWLDLAPWHEEAHRRLIYWLAVTGQPSAALKQYLICQRVLADELGVAPAPETTALYDEIQRKGMSGNSLLLTMPAYTGVSSLLPLPTHNLPRQLHAVVGRERELAYIAARLADPACAWLTLLGPGGIGKSCLAVEAAYAQLLHFSDGVWLVPLAGIASADLLPAAIAQTLAVPLQIGGDLRDQLLSYLQNKQLLLVLDNFEHLLEGVNLLDAIVQQGSQVKILVTSREALHHQAEWIVDVGGLAVPSAGDKDQLEEIEQYSSVQLFVQSAQRTQAAFVLTAADAPYVAQICRNLAGMPLGIKLAAAWVRTLPCATISAEISHNLDFANLAPHGLPDRHQSLRAVIDSSWQRLTVEEQAVLAKLALFRREFGLEGAQIVAGATANVLTRLVDKSLLHVDPQLNPQMDQANDFKRYSLHELLCQFGLEKLAASGQLEATRATHALYYTTWLAQQAGALTGSNPQPTLRLIDLELDNIRAAWQWAIQHYHAAAVVAAAPVLNLYHDYRTLLQDALQLFCEAAEAFRHAPFRVENEIARCKVLGYYALYLFRFGQSIEAERVLHESLAIATRHDAVAEQTYALYVLGYNANATGAQGEGYLLAGLALAEASNDHFLMVKLLYALGWYYGATHQTLASLGVLERALGLARSLGDLRSEAHIQFYLGRLKSEMGNYHEAKQDLEASLHHFQELEVHWGIAQAEHGLIEVAYFLQDYAEAKRLCEITIPLYEKIKAHGDSLRQIRELYALVSAASLPHRAA